MFVDMLLAFLSVTAILAVVLAALWLVAKVIGYVVSVFEGEPLIGTIKGDWAMTRREIRRTRGRKPERRMPGAPRPTA